MTTPIYIPITRTATQFKNKEAFGDWLQDNCQLSIDQIETNFYAPYCDYDTFMIDYKLFFSP